MPTRPGNLLEPSGRFHAPRVRGYAHRAQACEFVSGWISLATHEYQENSLAGSVEWTTQCVVTPREGSRTVLATTGSHEGAYDLWYMHLCVVERATSCGDSGCHDGWMYNALAFAVLHGISTVGTYLCRETGGTCSSSSCALDLACRLQGCSHRQ